MPRDPTEFLLEVLQHFPEDYHNFQFRTIQQNCEDHDDLNCPEDFQLLELSVCTNSVDYLKTHQPSEFFASLTESLNDFCGTPQNKKNRRRFPRILF